MSTCPTETETATTPSKKRQRVPAWPPMKPATKNGKAGWLVDARINKKGERRFFRLKGDAEGFVILKSVEREQGGRGAVVSDELARYGWNVAKAIDFALAHLRATEASVTLPEAIKSLIEQKAASGKSVRYQRDLGLRLKRLASAMRDKRIGAVTTADLDGFLSGLNVAPGTVNTFRRDVRTLWSFAEKRGWARAETAKHTDRATASTAAPGILTPAQAAALLTATDDPETLAFHAVGLFAGLRVAEIMRLDWSEVDFEGGFIHITASKAKTRQRRLVPILDNLRAWLMPMGKRSGPVVSREIRQHHEAARAAAGIKQWPQNAMRHSFVSYRLAATGNAAATALESGHDQAVLFAHYRELVRPKTAATYFAIQPEAVSNVTPYAASA